MAYIFLCLPSRGFRPRRTAAPRRAGKETRGRRGAILPPRNRTTRCNTYDHGVPTVRAFTRPASNIVAKFVFTNVESRHTKLL